MGQVEVFVIPQLQYRRYVPRLQVLLSSGTASKYSSYLPRFGVSIHITSGASCWSRHWSKCFSPSTDVYMQACDKVAKPPIPRITLCCCSTPKHDCITSLHTPTTTPSVTISKKPSAHATVRWSEMEIYKF